MDIQSLLTSLETVLHEQAGLGYFIDLLLKSVFVLFLIILINFFTRKFSASIRHLVWCIGFISLFFLPLFIGLLPKIHVPITTTETVIIENTVTQGIVTFAEKLPLLMGAWWEAFVQIYLALLGIQGCYILLGLIKVFSIHRSSLPVENELIHKELENLSFDEGITVTVSLKKNSDVFSPVSWGLFSPEIILPEEAETWDINKTRHVLIHELSHIQRLDWLTNLIVRITCAIYWYNPLIWYAAGKLEAESEQACDDAVILDCRCHNEYASNLLEIASQARVKKLGNTLVQAIAGSPLGSRVFSILDTSRKRQKTEVDWVVRGLLMGCTVMAILASLRLVPIVNVTSIDPHASTAFSVIFIPKSEAATFGSYVENLYSESEREQLVNRQSRTIKNEEELNRGAQLQDRDLDGRQAVPRDREAREPGGVLAQTKSPVEVDQSVKVEDEDVSLLDEYILMATGQQENMSPFESYVTEYASGVIRNVQENIDLNNLENNFTDDSNTTQSALVAIKKISPDYPRRALQRGLEGYSVVEYNIDSTGKVIDPVIVESKPGRVFNRSSIRAIQNYLFEPPKRNGEVVKVEGLQTKFVYQLKSG